MYLALVPLLLASITIIKIFFIFNIIMFHQALCKRLVSSVPCCVVVKFSLEMQSKMYFNEELVVNALSREDPFDNRLIFALAALRVREELLSE